MTRYQELINQLQVQNAEQAEYLQEEVDIIIHKLKFLDRANFPKTLIIDQAQEFAPVYTDLLAEKVTLAGGKLMDNYEEGADVIIILQANEALYSELPEWLNREQLTSVQAIQQDKVYIIQNTSFNKADESYLADLEILAEIIQSKYFFYGRDGQDWVKFSIAS